MHDKTIMNVIFSKSENPTPRITQGLGWGGLGYMGGGGRAAMGYTRVCWRNYASMMTNLNLYDDHLIHLKGVQFAFVLPKPGNENLCFKQVFSKNSDIRYKILSMNPPLISPLPPR